MKKFVVAVLCLLSLLLAGCGYMQSDLDDAFERGYESGLDSAQNPKSPDFAADVWENGYEAGIKDGYYGAEHGFDIADAYGMWHGDFPDE
jgi:hypothetical protein